RAWAPKVKAGFRRECARYSSEPHVFCAVWRNSATKTRCGNFDALDQETAPGTAGCFSSACGERQNRLDWRLKSSEDPMGLRICVAIMCACAITLGTMAVPDADAATKKRAVAKKVVVKGSPRARITVQPRSFLDPGREVLPGSQGYFT